MLKTYVNRYGDKYYFEPISDDKFRFVMEGNSMKYCRFGGLEGTPGIDYNNLGFFDPSGGPFIEIGTAIQGRIVKKISSLDDGQIILEMK